MDAGEYALWISYRAQPSIEVRDRIVERYIRWTEWIATKYHRWTGHQHDVGDMINDAFLGLLDAINAFDAHRGIQFSVFAKLRIIGAIQDGMRKRDWLSRKQRMKVGNDVGQPVELEFEPACDAAPSQMDADDWWEDACEGLSTRERFIVLQYFREQKEFAQIGTSLGVSGSRVTQVMKRVLNRIRERMTSKELRGPVSQSNSKRRRNRIAQMNAASP